MGELLDNSLKGVEDPQEKKLILDMKIRNNEVYSECLMILEALHEHYGVWHPFSSDD